MRLLNDAVYNAVRNAARGIEDEQTSLNQKLDAVRKRRMDNRGRSRPRYLSPPVGARPGSTHPVRASLRRPIRVSVRLGVLSASTPFGLSRCIRMSLDIVLRVSAHR